jgi:hypothetical protein
LFCSADTLLSTKLEIISVKRKTLVLASVFLSSSLVVFAASKSIDEEFGVKEYDEFHRVLHPLEHEALPKKDFARIRSKAPELVKLGKTIVGLGVPQGTAEKNVEEFKRELNKFDAALNKLNADAEGGTDDQLKVSYSSVHDSFEVLAAMLPRKGM